MILMWVVPGLPSEMQCCDQPHLQSDACKRQAYKFNASFPFPSIILLKTCFPGEEDVGFKNQWQSH